MDSKQRVAALSAELEEKTRELERAGRLKSEFLANMSHELRTPLNGVIGFADLLLFEPGAMTAEQVEYAEHIQRSGRHLLSLINSVLQLAEIEAGELALDLETLDPHLEIGNALPLVAPAAALGHVAIHWRGGASRFVRADREQLRQIVLNLISNAIKFSPPNSEVAVETSDEGSFVRISVRDQGVGISAPVVRELFKPFFQAEASMEKTYQGMGLGLAITKNLVERHGGVIDAESTPGKGSKFSFTLPAGPPLASSAKVASPPGEALRPRIPPAADKEPGSRPLVLVVEDDRINARLLEAFLEHNGFQVAKALTATEALVIARRRNPQAILLDLILSDGEDGLVVLGQLKRGETTRDIPVIVVSSLPEELRSRELGASGFLIKPVEPAPLLALLRALVPERRRKAE
jgi:CheY-like chemotaxis protein